MRALLSLQPSSYSGGWMVAGQPHAWCQTYQGGRSFYTGGGHTPGSYDEPEFRVHLLGGVRYAVGQVVADCAPGVAVRDEERHHGGTDQVSGGGGRDVQTGKGTGSRLAGMAP